jgi:hypothetical protein
MLGEKIESSVALFAEVLINEARPCTPERSKFGRTQEAIECFDAMRAAIRVRVKHAQSIESRAEMIAFVSRFHGHRVLQ